MKRIMRFNKAVWFLCVAVLTFSEGWAGELVLFSAAEAGADAWVWGTARVRQAGDALLITERNPEADYGDARVADRFPFFEDARIEFEVAEVSGRYSLQVLAFRGGDYVESVDLARDEDRIM